ncbi:DUF5995 family protein [Streptomyces sp. NPDC059708]|uniref:DUF5995 family protein n=1 Tax=Streptomyces sp. NPDC059708 TaxID=3346916 RepID=UPI0036B8F561
MTAESMLPAEKVARVAALLADRVRQYDTAHADRAAFAYTYFRLTTTLDLPHALQRMATSTGDRGRIADFQRMNDVLASCIDRVQDDLASRYIHGLGFLDRLFTRDDELLTNYGIRVARGLAWFNCDRLLDPDGTEEASRSIGRSTAALIGEIRSPDDWKLRAGSWILRRLIPERRHWPMASAPLA